MYQSIVVPLDGSPFGEHALSFALTIARRTDATLHLVHVHGALETQHRPGTPHDDDMLDSQQRAAEQTYLADVMQRLTNVWDGPITTTLLDGPVAATLLDHVATCGADLVVMTTHGRGAVSRFWLGSVADRVLRHAPMPILLIRPGETAADLTRAPVFTHMLIPLDGSALAEQVLPHATALGRLMDANYTLLQAVNPILTSYGPEVYVPSDEILDQWLSMAQAYLDGVADRLRIEGLQVQAKVVLGAPALGVLDYARTHQVDLIALATHGRGGFSRLFLGSVADKMVRSADVPILVYRPVDGRQTENDVSGLKEDQ
jgi:nucleotide-binding universal stress UspA family protein